jgi:rare lipoprotein A
MVFSKLRSSAVRSAAALCAASLMISAPVQAVEIATTTPLQDVAAAIADLQDPAVAADIIFQPFGKGVASYYGNELAGHRTASGERFNPSDLTAAHRSLPLGSKIRVTNNSNGRSVVVRVNDRGPWTGGRVLDISYAAAQQIGMIRSGKAVVSIERLM